MRVVKNTWARRFFKWICQPEIYKLIREKGNLESEISQLEYQLKCERGDTELWRKSYEESRAKEKLLRYRVSILGRQLNAHIKPKLP